jgi:hypothetical protein
MILPGWLSERSRIVGDVRRAVARDDLVLQSRDLSDVQQIVRDPGDEQVAGAQRPERRMRVRVVEARRVEPRQPRERPLALDAETSDRFAEVTGVVRSRGDDPLRIELRPGSLRIAERDLETCAEVLRLLVREMVDDLEDRQRSSADFQRASSAVTPRTISSIVMPLRRSCAMPL